MGPLRFCFVTTFYPPYHFGGDAIFVYRLAQALAERGHSVHVIHSMDAYRLGRGGSPSIEFATHDNVRTFPLETTWPLASSLASYELGTPALYGRTLRKHFLQHSYDVVHYHNVSLIGGPAVLRLGNAIKLYTAHEYWLVCPTHALFKYEREACVKKDCLSCTVRSGRPPQAWRYSQILAESLRGLNALLLPSQFSMRRHKADGITVPMRVLPHSVPVPAQIPEWDSNNDHPARPYFLFAGQLEKLKGADDAIELFKHLPNVDLIIAGTGSLESKLREQAKGCSSIQFVGSLHPDALAQLYQRATATLVPSRCYETFALSAAESMAHGTPVIGRRLGAVQELIECSGGGITFNSQLEFLEGVERLLANDERRRVMGQCGRAYALAHWTMETHLDEYMGLIERMLKGAPGESSISNETIA